VRFRDQLVRCGACGRQFVVTVNQQRQRAEQGLPAELPVFCPDCRGADVRLAEVASRTSQPPTPATEHSGAAEPGAAAATRRGTRRPEEPRQRPGRKDARDDGRRSTGQTRAGPGGVAAASGRPRGEGSPPGPRAGRGERRGQGRTRQTELRVRFVGTVKWFDRERGYGFIADDDGGELFVHSTAVLAADGSGLSQGQPVEYEVERTDRGLQAVDVVPLAC